MLLSTSSPLGRSITTILLFPLFALTGTLFSNEDLPDFLKVETFAPPDPMLDDFEGAITVRENPRIGTDVDMAFLRDIVPDLSVSDDGIAMDFNDWWMEGSLEHADWIADEEGRYIFQRANHFMPAFLVAPEPADSIELAGQIAVFDDNDQDHIGLVMGYQAPLREKGHNVNQHDYILFAWNRLERHLRVRRPFGFELLLVQGVDQMTEAQWTQRVSDQMRNHMHSPHFQNRSTPTLQFHPLVEHTEEHEYGWEPNVIYNVRLLYSPERILISLQGGEGSFSNERIIYDLSIDDVDPELFPEGRFPAGHYGFYNMSQENSFYGSFFREQFADEDRPAFFEFTPGPLGGRPYYIIFDASGSMMAPMDGQRKFDVAREALIGLINEIPDGSPLSLRVYGHSKRAIEPGADEDTELVYQTNALTDAERAAAISRINAIRPMGRTPLALSLQQALRDIRPVFRGEATFLILLTDGGEDTTSGGVDPEEAAGQVGAREDIDFTIVGFDIHRPSWQEQLEAMASFGGARYLAVDDAESLAEEFLNAARHLNLTLEITNEETGDTFTLQEDERLEAQPGVYTLKEFHGGREIRQSRVWLRPGMRHVHTALPVEE